MWNANIHNNPFLHSALQSFALENINRPHKFLVPAIFQLLQSSRTHYNLKVSAITIQTNAKSIEYKFF